MLLFIQNDFSKGLKKDHSVVTRRVVIYFKTMKDHSVVISVVSSFQNDVSIDLKKTILWSQDIWLYQFK